MWRYPANLFYMFGSVILLILVEEITAATANRSSPQSPSNAIVSPPENSQQSNDSTRIRRSRTKDSLSLRGKSDQAKLDKELQPENDDESDGGMPEMLLTSDAAGDTADSVTALSSTRTVNYHQPVVLTELSWEIIVAVLFGSMAGSMLLTVVVYCLCGRPEEGHLI